MYEVVEFHKSEINAINHPELIKWKIFRWHDEEWVEAKGNNKTGKKVTFNFSQKAYSKKILIEAYIYEPEMKAPPGLIVKAVMGEPKIDKLEICNAHGDALTETPSYGQSIVLKVHTHNMVGETLKLSFWEKDTVIISPFDPKYHDPKGDTALWNGTVKVLKNNGIAEAKILLAPSIAMLANKKLFDKSVHHYYVLAEAANHLLGKKEITTAPKTSERPLIPVAPKATPKPVKAAPSHPDKGTSILDRIKIDINNIIGWDVFTPDGSNKKVIVEVPDSPKKEEEKSKCPRCKAPVTASDLKKIFTEADDSILTTAATTYTKYMKELGMDTC